MFNKRKLEASPMTTNYPRASTPWWHRVKTRMITWIIPKHIQRGIYTCSLAAALLPSDQKTREKAARKIVEELRIACAYKAMLAPMAWNKSIWKTLPATENLKDSTTLKIVEMVPGIIATAPEALRYASPRTMFEDTLKTLKMVSQFQGV